MPFLLTLGLWCLAELIVFVIVFLKAGFLITLALIFFSSTVGMLLIRQQRANMTVMMHTPAEKYSARDGVYHFTAGMLLVIPGFLSSLVGLIFLIAPLRRLAGAGLLKILRPNRVADAFFNFDHEKANYARRESEENAYQEVTAKREDGTEIKAELVDEPRKK